MIDLKRYCLDYLNNNGINFTKKNIIGKISSLNVNEITIEEILVKRLANMGFVGVNVDPYLEKIDAERQELANELLLYLLEKIKSNNINSSKKIEIAFSLLKKIIECNTDMDFRIEKLKTSRLNSIYNKYEKTALSELLKENSPSKMNKIALEAEKQLAFQLADMGARWRISNIDFFGKFKKTWKKIRGGKNVTSVPRLQNIHQDVLTRISKKAENGEFQPVGNCSDQARTNFLYLISKNLSGNALQGKTIMQVGSTTANHSYIIVSKLSIEQIQTLRNVNKNNDYIDLKELKKIDPDFYIIDSWRMGCFNKPEMFLHWSPFDKWQKKTASNPYLIRIQAIGSAGCPEKAFSYKQWKSTGDYVGWVNETVDINLLNNNAAWQDFNEKVITRHLPTSVVNAMKKDNKVITYRQ